MKNRILKIALFALLAAVIPLFATGHAPAQELNAARQQKLLRHLEIKGFNSSVEKSQARLLGVTHNDAHIPVRKVQFYDPKLMYAFSRIGAGATGYFFLFDPERSNINSTAIMFRTDLDFKVVGVGLIWVNGKPEPLSPERSAKLFAEVMRDFAAGVDGKFNRLSGK